MRRGRLLLTAITALAVFLRLWRLPDLPPGLWHDEALVSLLAREAVAARSFPIYFAADFGGIHPLIVYLTILARWATGNHPLAIRFGVAVVGGLTVPIFFFALRAIFRLDDERDEWSTTAGLLGALVLAMLFPYVLLNRVGFEVMLPAPLAALCFGGLAAAIRSRRPLHFVLAGAALGVSLYSYYSARLLPLAVLLAGLWMLTLVRPARRYLPGMLLAAAAAVGVALPLAAYFLGHPQVFAARTGVASYNTLGPGAESVVRAVALNALRTLAGLSLPGFGDALARHNLPGRPFFDPFLSALFWAGFVWLLLTPKRRSSALLVSWAAVMSLPVILTDGAPTFTRFLAAAPALAGACAAGGVLLYRVIARHRERLAGGVLIAGLTFSLIVNTRDYFVRWADDPRLFDAFQVGDWQAAMLARERAASDAVYLSPPHVNPSRPTFDLLLRDSTVRSFPGDRCLVYRDRSPMPATYLVDSLADRDSLGRLAGLFPSGQPGPRILHQPEPFPLFETFLVPALAAASPPSAESGAVFGERMRLLGYSVSPSRVRAGETVTLELSWQAVGRMDFDYTVLVHFFAPGAEGEPPAAQSDGMPCGGALPTSGWQVGEIVLDSMPLSLPAAFGHDRGLLAVGVYAWPSPDRLPVSGTGQRVYDDRVVLTEIEVER